MRLVSWLAAAAAKKRGAKSVRLVLVVVVRCHPQLLLLLQKLIPPKKRKSEPNLPAKCPTAASPESACLKKSWLNQLASFSYLIKILEKRVLLGMRLIARSGLSTRTVRIADRFMLMEVTEYSRALKIGDKREQKN